MTTNAKDRPEHYNAGEIECIDGIRSALGPDGFRAFCRGAAIKYLWRAGLKADGEDDLRKAIDYTRWALGEEPREYLWERTREGPTEAVDERVYSADEAPLCGNRAPKAHPSTFPCILPEGHDGLHLGHIGGDWHSMPDEPETDLCTFVGSDTGAALCGHLYPGPSMDVNDGAVTCELHDGHSGAHTADRAAWTQPLRWPVCAGTGGTRFFGLPECGAERNEPEEVAPIGRCLSVRSHDTASNPGPVRCQGDAGHEGTHFSGLPECGAEWNDEVAPHIIRDEAVMKRNAETHDGQPRCQVAELPGGLQCLLRLGHDGRHAMIEGPPAFEQPLQHRQPMQPGELYPPTFAMRCPNRHPANGGQCERGIGHTSSHGIDTGTRKGDRWALDPVSTFERQCKESSWCAQPNRHPEQCCAPIDERCESVSPGTKTRCRLPNNQHVDHESVSGAFSWLSNTPLVFEPTRVEVSPLSIICEAVSMSVGRPCGLPVDHKGEHYVEFSDGRTYSWDS